MKNIFRTFLVACCTGIILTSCFHNNSDISISVKETDDVYRFTASFPKGKTAEVQNFIAKKISSKSLFASPDDYVDIGTVLDDNTRFRIKSSPGKLRIQLDRYENTPASQRRLKDICEEIKGVLVE